MSKYVKDFLYRIGNVAEVDWQPMPSHFESPAVRKVDAFDSVKKAIDGMKVGPTFPSFLTCRELVGK